MKLHNHNGKVIIQSLADDGVHLVPYTTLQLDVDGLSRPDFPKQKENWLVKKFKFLLLKRKATLITASLTYSIHR